MITGLVSALVIGAIIGALGRLVLPGKQNISVPVTIAVGVAAALLGSLLAGLLGVASTRGIDWIELALQVGLAVLGVSLLTRSSARRSSRRSARRL